MASTLLLVVVFVLDLIAFALAVAAEQRRSTASIASDGKSNWCAYDSDISTGLGAGAVILFLASQLLIMWLARCLCCGRALHPGRSRSQTIAFFITCWVTFFAAEVCLLAGSVRNAYHTKYVSLVTDQHPSCETLRKGVFGAGAAFIVFTAISSALFYYSYSKADKGSPSQHPENGIRMGSM